ncbi:accessory gene regulator B family protein, partial [Bifidobacterium animalis]|nr:accessory gene regulator B family protein [Bifidobacterium animalis]
MLLLFLGLMTNHFIEAVVYEIVLSSTRSILGGYHCKSYAACICTYAGFFLAGVIFLNYYHFTLMTILIV